MVQCIQGYVYSYCRKVGLYGLVSNPAQSIQFPYHPALTFCFLKRLFVPSIWTMSKKKEMQGPLSCAQQNGTSLMTLWLAKKCAKEVASKLQRFSRTSGNEYTLWCSNFFQSLSMDVQRLVHSTSPSPHVQDSAKVSREDTGSNDLTDAAPIAEGESSLRGIMKAVNTCVHSLATFKHRRGKRLICPSSLRIFVFLCLFFFVINYFVVVYIYVCLEHCSNN